jgi:hypothetical protein
MVLFDWLAQKGGATSNKQWSHQEKGAMKQKKLSQRFDALPFHSAGVFQIPYSSSFFLSFTHFIITLSCKGNGRFFE